MYGPVPTGQSFSVRFVRGQSRLRVKLVGFPRHRCEETDRQPVFELRVLADQPDAQRVIVERLGAGEIMVAKVEKRQAAARSADRPLRSFLIHLADLLAVLLQPRRFSPPAVKMTAT